MPYDAVIWSKPLKTGDLLFPLAYPFQPKTANQCEVSPDADPLRISIHLPAPTFRPDPVPHG